MSATPSPTSTQPPTGRQDQLVLGSQLAEMERLPPWVEALASAHSISETTTFGIHLCLEEVVSNIIRHGYNEQPGHTLTVIFTSPRPGHLLFTVEDEAPPFNPLDRATPAVPDQPADILGGQGIRLLRGFAESVTYEAKPRGNRLLIGFADEQ